MKFYSYNNIYSTIISAAEIVSNEEMHANQNFSDDVSVDKNEVSGTVSKTGEAERKGSKTDAEEICQNEIHLRVKHLESELASVLHLLRSRSKAAVSFKVSLLTTLIICGAYWNYFPTLDFDFTVLLRVITMTSIM